MSLHLFYHNPHSPYGFSSEAIPGLHLEWGINIWKQLLSGRITCYNQYRKSHLTGDWAPGTIVVKRSNYLVLDLPLLPFSHQLLYPLMYTAWREGNLHSFDLADYPELFI